MESPATVAVVGLGSIGLQHVDAFLANGAKRILVFDPHEPAREVAAARSGAVQPVGSFDQLLDAAPEALVIATPDHLHVPQLSAAVMRGITTLVEKPLGDDLNAVAEAMPLLVQHRDRIMVGYVLRHNPTMERTRRLIESGAIGAPVSFQVMLGALDTIIYARSRFATPSPNRLLRDYSHEWDYVAWLFGTVDSVLAVSRTVNVEPLEAPNVADGLLKCSESIGAFHLDYVDPRGTRTLHVIGTGGVLFADVGRGTVVLRRKDEDGATEYSHDTTAALPLRRQDAHLLEVARGYAQPLVTLDDGFAAMRVAAAAERSFASGLWESSGADSYT